MGVTTFAYRQSSFPAPPVCTHSLGTRLPFSVPVHGHAGGAGARHRRVPTGGAAMGMPEYRNTVALERRTGSVAPETGPHDVMTVGAPSAAPAAAAYATASTIARIAGIFIALALGTLSGTVRKTLSAPRPALRTSTRTFDEAALLPPAINALSPTV